MKLSVSLNVFVLLSATLLAGCATTPPTPAFQLTDTALCTELGHAQAVGDSARVAEVIDEGKSREARNALTIDQGTCTTLAQTGANAAQQESIQAQQQRQAWASASAQLQQYAAQQQQQEYQQQQLANQQMQQAQQNMNAWQQTQALNRIANGLNGY